MKTLNLVPRAEMSAALVAICLLITCASFTTVNPLLTPLSQMINKPPPLLFKGRKLISPPPSHLSFKHPSPPLFILY